MDESRVICRKREVSNQDSRADQILIFDTGADQSSIGGPAWEIIHRTGDEVRCNGYLKGEFAQDGPILPIVSGMTCVRTSDGDRFILIVHQALYYDDDRQDESLCLPFQAEQHGVKFSLTPSNRLDSNNQLGKQNMVIEHKEIPIEFDGRKLYLKISRPSEQDIKDLESYELTSPEDFVPEPTSTDMTNRRRSTTKRDKQYPGGLTLDDWRRRLAMAPPDVIRKTFQATTQLGMNLEINNRAVGRRHFKTRFPFLKQKRLNDTFHSDTFFPSVTTLKGNTCSQIFFGEHSDYMYVHPLKRESHAINALEDFGRKIGLPSKIKTDNAKTEVGEKWTTWCRNHRVDTLFTEPMSPWQNKAEHAIGNLATMVKRCMKEFNAPLSRHDWCQRWCADVRNHLASRKLEWRTPQEVLNGETPDISVFRFHFWEPIEYYEPAKQPRDGWENGRFLGIAWDSGDCMTYYIEPEGGNGRTVLVRSNIRSRRVDKVNSPSLIPDSGESVMEPDIDSNEFNIQEHPGTKQPTDTPTTTDDPHDDTVSLQEETTNQIVEDVEIGINVDDEIELAQDDAFTNCNEPDDDISIPEDDQHNLHQQILETIENTEEDYEFQNIISHRWNDGILLFQVQLTSGKTFEISFKELKSDRPLEVAKYIRKEVVEEKRGGPHEIWAKKIITNANRTIRRLSRHYNIDRYIRLRSTKNITIRRISRNKRNESMTNREKFGIRIPNNVKEALTLDRINNNTLWADAIYKEMSALNKAKCFKYYPPTYRVPTSYQYAPLRMIFDIKQEDLRRKARLVAGGHVVDSNMYESYSSVIQTRTIRLLQTVAMSQGLKMVTGDISNAFVQAPTCEKIWTRAGKEFGERENCVIIFDKALYGLATSARQWNLTLGKEIKEMGFKQCRADPDLWIKKNEESQTYEYIATYVDDLIMVMKDPQPYIEHIKEKFPIRNIEFKPQYYLGANITMNDRNMKVSMEKYIKEALRKYESKHGPIRKENVPATFNDHPELDETPYLDQEGITHFQSVMGICQWISTAARMDITFAVSSLSRFAAKPREGHLKRAIKIFGYLKKYPKKGFYVDPREPILNVQYEELIPDFGNQYDDFTEDVDDKLPDPLMKELPITIFVDSNHGHDKITGKSITGLVVFVGRTPIFYQSKRQASVQTATFGAEFIALKKAVEEAITTRYYLRSMGVRITKPTVIYGDNLSAIKNTTNPSSQLQKKYLALAYHFCREHFSAGIVSIRKIPSKDNYSDAFTKALVSSEFHGIFNEIMAK